jgi:photosystem II stability/assembly factor-like uncharacterized protein
MNSGFGRSTAVTCGLLLLVSMAFADWEQLNSGTLADLYVVHFLEGTQVGYAFGAEPTGGGAVVKTTDGGNTWVLQSSGMVPVLKSVYFKDNNNGYAVGDAGTALRTTDGGATWIPMTVPGTDMLTRVQFPENSQVGYIGVHPDSGALVLKTTDGGDNWTSISVGGPMDWSYSCGFATDVIGVVVGYDGFVVGTTSGQQDPSTTADLIAAAFSPTDPNTGYLIGNDSTRGVIRYTDDGGATPWDSVRCHTTRAFYGVDMPTSEVAFVCGTDGIILRSVYPIGFYGTTVPMGLTATMYGVCFPNGADTGYAVGSGGTILRTYDSGIPLWGWVAEGKAPAVSRAEIRIVSNPSRHGIAFYADAAVSVVAFDAAGRIVARQTATKGMNFLPLSKAGVYMVKVTADGFSTTQKLVVQH